MILIIDNYDSFTYNLVQRLGEIDASLESRCTATTASRWTRSSRCRPSHLIISPGPCTPNEAGISVDCVQRFMGKMPILGVCLGHQSIGQATGGEIVRARELMHGKTDAHSPRQPGAVRRVCPIRSSPRDTTVWSFGQARCARISRWPPGPSRGRASARSWRFVIGVFPWRVGSSIPRAFLTECGHELLRRFLQQTQAS